MAGHFNTNAFISVPSNWENDLLILHKQSTPGDQQDSKIENSLDWNDLDCQSAKP